MLTPTCSRNRWARRDGDTNTCSARAAGGVPQDLGSVGADLPDHAGHRPPALVAPTLKRLQKANADIDHDIALKLTYLKDVASGILQLHMAKVAHQDLKPSNVMVFEMKWLKLVILEGRAVRIFQVCMTPVTLQAIELCSAGAAISTSAFSIGWIGACVATFISLLL